MVLKLSLEVIQEEGDGGKVVVCHSKDGSEVVLVLNFINEQEQQIRIVICLKELPQALPWSRLCPRNDSVVNPSLTGLVEHTSIDSLHSHTSRRSQIEDGLELRVWFGSLVELNTKDSPPAAFECLQDDISPF